MSLVLDTIAASTAELERLVPEQVAPFGYGRDLSCVLDVTPNLDEVDPNSTRAIAEALVRRAITPNGTLPGEDDAEYGEDIRGYLNRATPLDELRDLSNRLRNEFGKDDRVESCTVSAVLTGVNLAIHARVTPVSNARDFSFTFGIRDGDLFLEDLA